MLQALQKEEARPNQEPRPTLDERFLIKLGNREFVQYPGLLDMAHQKGLAKLEVEVIQLPNPENNHECIVRATAVTESGLVCTDLGDANAKNTSSLVSKHLIRMASTRAKARVLRDITNIGITSLEELGDEPDVLPGHGNEKGNGKGRAKSRKAAGKATTPSNGNNAIVPVTDAQKRALWHLGKAQGYNEQTLHELAHRSFGCGVATLNSKDAATLIKQLQQAT